MPSYSTRPMIGEVERATPAAHEVHKSVAVLLWQSCCGCSFCNCGLRHSCFAFSLARKVRTPGFVSCGFLALAFPLFVALPLLFPLSLLLLALSLSLSLSFVRDSCLTLFTLRCVAYIFVSSSSIEEEDDTKKLRRDRITQKLLKLRKYSISCSELLRKFVCPDFYTPISTRRPPGRSPVLRKPSGAAAVAALLLRR